MDAKEKAREKRMHALQSRFRSLHRRFDARADMRRALHDWRVWAVALLIFAGTLLVMVAF